MSAVISTFRAARLAMITFVVAVASSCGSTQLDPSGAQASTPTMTTSVGTPDESPSPTVLEFPNGFTETMERHGLILEPIGLVETSVSADEAVDVAVSTRALFGRDDPLKVELFRASLPRMGPLSDPNDPGSAIVPTYVDVPMWVIYAQVELPKHAPSPKLGTVMGTAVAVVTAEGEAVSAWTF